MARSKSIALWLSLVLISILPILFAVGAPTDNSIAKLKAEFVAGPYFLFFVFILYLVGISVMSWNGSHSSRQRRKANEALAIIEEQYKKGNTVIVIRDCQEQLLAYPNDAALHWYLALATYAQKDFQIARTHFLRAAEIDPRFEPQIQPFLQKGVTNSNSELMLQQHLH